MPFQSRAREEAVSVTRGNPLPDGRGSATEAASHTPFKATTRSLTNGAPVPPVQGHRDAARRPFVKGGAAGWTS